MSAPAPDVARAERRLALLLRVLGFIDLLAVVAVVMPSSWLDAGIRLCGLGERPPGPLVGYLARSAAALYLLQGAATLYLSTDVRRYGPFITFLAAAALVHGGVLVAIDLAEGMPAWWVAVEGGGYALIGVVVLALQRLVAAARRAEGA